MVGQNDLEGLLQPRWFYEISFMYLLYKHFDIGRTEFFFNSALVLFKFCNLKA